MVQEERENTRVQSLLEVTFTVDSLFKKISPPIILAHI